MDAATKIFFNLEEKRLIHKKKFDENRLIHALRSESGSLLADSTYIRRRAVCFYEKLYKFVTCQMCLKKAIWNSASHVPRGIA